MKAFPVSLNYDTGHIVGTLTLNDEVLEDLDCLVDMVVAPGYTIDIGQEKVDKVHEFSLIQGERYDRKTHKEKMADLHKVKEESKK